MRTPADPLRPRQMTDRPNPTSGPRRPIRLERFQFVPPAWYTIHQCFCDYARERLIAKGKDANRAWGGFNNFMEVVEPPQEVTKLTTGQVEDFIDLRTSQGVTAATVVRELTFVKAAINYAHRRNRIGLVPYIELPDAQHKFRRPLTEEEYRLVMKQPMSGRLYRFYRLGYYTGHRPRAMEELTWGRTDLERGFFDFNVPGRLVTNKRRNGAFPIPDEFLDTLRGWKSMAKDEYVIGTGGSTYHEAAYVVRVRAGIKDPTLVPRHCLRKMFATVLFERKANPELVAKLMADRADTVRKYYFAPGEAKLRDVVNLRAQHAD